ncbi:MAG: YfhO family protein [Armatimonadota bacterium]|nr:YfhO family protein [Armatimonadota bacterium]
MWRPIFNGEVLLPGDYLAEMLPWKAAAKPHRQAPQWNPLQWDAIAQFYPWRVFYARCVREGKIPLWNPHQFCGTPFLANAQSAVLYPPNLLFIVCDPIVAWTAYAALHLFLAGFFMHLLLRELGCSAGAGLIGGVCYAFCAFNIRWLELPTFVGASVWLPVIVLLVHRAVVRRSASYAVCAGLAQAMAFLAGHFQIAFYVLLAAAAWWLWRLCLEYSSSGCCTTIRNAFTGLTVFVVVAGLVASPQVLPTVELARSSHRVRDVSAEGYARFVANGVAAYRLITAFAPDFYGNPSRGDYFLGSAADFIEYGLYIGVMPLFLTIAGLFHAGSRRYVLFFVLLALFAILCATGTPLNYPFYYLIPGFSALGGPNRILLLYFFAVAALVGFGTDWLAAQASRQIVRRQAGFRLGVAAAIASILLLGLAFAVAYFCALAFLSQVGWSAIPDPTKWYTPLAALTIVSLAVILARSFDLLRGPTFQIAAILIATADLFAFGVNYNPTCARSEVYPETRLIKELKRLTADGSRIAPINERWSLYRVPSCILPPNAAMVYSINDVQGYDSLYTRVYKDLSSAIQGIDSSPIENGNMVLIKRITPRLAQLADYVLTTEKLSESTLGVRLVGYWDGVYVYKISGEHPGSSYYRPRISFFSYRLGLFLGCLGVATAAGIVCCCWASAYWRTQ